MNAAQVIPIIAITAYFSFALYLLIVDFLIPNQNARNKAKQEAKERAAIDELFCEAPTTFLQRGSAQRHQEDFDNQMKEVLN